MKKTLFIYLTAFSYDGGIEKFNRAFIYAMSIIAGDCSVRSMSLHDHTHSSKYTRNTCINCFSGRKRAFVWNAIRRALRTQRLIVGHINLAIVGVVAKWLKPQLQLVLVAHGIDVWYELPPIKRRLLQKADLILAVSTFTRDKLIEVHNVSPEKIKIFPNTVDPYFAQPDKFTKPDYLLQRYKLQSTDKIVLTVCRMSSAEGYKGYDHVIEALPVICATAPTTKYLLVGKYDALEKRRIDQLIATHKLEQRVIFAGFVPEEELTDHFLLGDVFVMPSKNEGFGIVFIEAMLCGLPVVAGNKDGSRDALADGTLGTLVSPESSSEIAHAIIEVFANKQSTADKNKLQNEITKRFGIERFVQRLQEVFLAPTTDIKEDNTLE